MTAQALDHAAVAVAGQQEAARAQLVEGRARALAHVQPGGLARGDDGIEHRKIEAELGQMPAAVVGPAARVGEEEDALAPRVQPGQGLERTRIGPLPVMEHAPLVDHEAFIGIREGGEALDVPGIGHGAGSSPSGAVLEARAFLGQRAPALNPWRHAYRTR